MSELDPELKLKALFLREYFRSRGDIPLSLESVQITPLRLIEWKQLDPWFCRMFEEHREMIVDSAAMKILERGVSGESGKVGTTLKALAQISQKYDTDYRKVVAVQEAVARARGYFTQQLPAPSSSSSEHPWQQGQLPDNAYDPIMVETSRLADTIVDAEFTNQSVLESEPTIGPEDI